ncbi:MAG: ATP-dependent RecD-like DNA helicase [Deltaproteobacteria bacterium]|nr:ATP-dependent RecD-like DNA helicase [Nannocystaceae bacterium]
MPLPFDPPRSEAAAQLVGTVERVVYHDERTRYTVMRVSVPGHSELATVVGRTISPETGAQLTVHGHWDSHPSHGRQFAFDRIAFEVPTTLGGIERRLTRYPGVKDVMAARIVARFGLDTLTVLESQPRRLLEVEGIGARTLEKIIEHHTNQVGPLAQLESQLLELDLPVYLGRPIFDRFGDDAIAVVRKQPYRLAREVKGIGFTTADRMARALGIAADSDERVEAGVLHTMEQAEQDGNCALPIEQLVRKAAQALGVSEELVRVAGEHLVAIGELVLEHGNDGTPLCFSPRLVAAEGAVADALSAMVGADHRRWQMHVLPPNLSAGQVEAVQAIADHGVVVLTGGPGTGKSTVVREILGLARAHQEELILCAPTGRAAKRLEQAAGHEARTIHRLLEFQPETGRFAHGPADPLPPGLVVVDESSMLDVALAQALLGALTPKHRLLLVGDADQLPSVGPGNVLSDIITAASTPGSPVACVRLTEVFRQAHGSTIVDNAHRMLRGEPLRTDEAGTKGEFFVIPARSAEHAHELVVRLATERIPEAYGLDGATEVQVLCPMHKGRAGTEALNDALQGKHTAGMPELEIQGGRGQLMRRFRVGDRVMQTKNDYNKNVFNGDVGVVRSVDREHGIVVDMDGTKITYLGNEAMALVLAYAVSIHKSQGSEFEAVIVTLLPEHQVMLRRNLLYTAVTRGRRLVVLVGDSTAIGTAVRTGHGGERWTRLAHELQSMR